MLSPDLESLIKLLAKLPGLGPRSGRRVALHLLKHKEALMSPLASALQRSAETVKTCSQCFSLDTSDPCTICSDPRRDHHLICVVEGVADLWALERSSSYRGLYHILGGTLSALEGVSPDDLQIPALLRRIQENQVQEVILGLNATVEGQTTAHYIADRLKESGISTTALAHGVPVGGELDYLDDSTLATALLSRRSL